MKRTRTIVADDGNTKVSVVVKVDAEFLSRGEVNAVSDIISSGVMNQLANTRYLSVYLSDIRVK